MNAQDDPLLQVRWQNTSADRTTSLHVEALELYWTEVVKPAIRVLVAKSDQWRTSENLVELIELEDYELAYRYTMQGFALAVQSMWERQLRNYLVVCADEQPSAGVTSKVLREAKWPELQSLFLRLRGVALNTFPSYDDLDLLQVLGNACRHGDGGSAKALFRRCPEIRDEGLRPSNSIWRPEEQQSPSTPEFERVTIPSALLEQLLLSVIWFWEDQELIFFNSEPGDLHKRIRSAQKCLERRGRRVRVWPRPFPA
jgi:hypothetical protein